MLSSKLYSSIGNTDRLYVDDVFSTYLYTGDGSTQTINNGIDLADKGGLVWTKKRNSATQGDHLLVDTVRGTSPTLISNSTAAQANYGMLSAFNSSGYTLTSDPFVNGSGNTYVSWTFRKAPKFFDVVTWFGDNNTSGKLISHSLGDTPGMVIVKAITGSSYPDWYVWHRSTGAVSPLKLNKTAAAGDALYQRIFGYYSGAEDPTATSFRAGELINQGGVAYVAYLFAHDTSADGFIQCGSYTGNGSATGPIVNLGWEPQYLMIKNASGTGNWQIIDNMRGMPVGSADATLQTNLNAAELSAEYVSSTATGFQITSTSSEVNTNGNSYIYLAIRRPNKPPTTGTEVYNAIARTGTGGGQPTVSGVGFPVDLLISETRTAGYGTFFIDRLRGGNTSLNATTIAAETAGGVASFTMDGYVAPPSGYGSVDGATTYINHFFKRAPGFFDVVCYDGADSVQARKHNLNASPGFVIVKSRYSYDSNWFVYCSLLGADKLLRLDSIADAQGFVGAWGGTANADVFYTSSVTSSAPFGKHVAYLFATLSGISKVGSYTGNGTTQTINCGFTTGARFILIKRTDSTGDWYVWDTARGIVSANDPHLSLNTAAAEVTTDDSVDPEASGFIVNQVAATNVNVTGATYIFLAVS